MAIFADSDMGDHDCLPIIKGYADQVDEQAGILENRDAD